MLYVVIIVIVVVLGLVFLGDMFFKTWTAKIEADHIRDMHGLGYHQSSYLRHHNELMQEKTFALKWEKNR